ncbi:MAG: 2-hydroxycarboxylate transporter family protein [Spirochaetaceae bacterium]|jgi:CCS family citrate carrier protein|nr:2-hydroxycarboxylate transporter family protein [Spirochaetaceae bacterium]
MTLQQDGANQEKKQTFQLFGIAWYYFVLFGAIVLTAVFLGKLPKGMIGAFPLMIVIGTIYGKLGDNAPFIKTFLGGGAIVTIFGSAALVTFKILPEAAIKTMQNFMADEGFLDFYIAALITGSIMGMNRKLLIRSALRYFPALAGGIALALLFVAITGAVTGYGAKEAVFFIGIPIMGGGMGAGAVPLSRIFSESLGKPQGEMIGIMIPAVALGNAFAIICGGLLDRLGKTAKSLSGNGKLMQTSAEAIKELEPDPTYIKARDTLNLTQIAAGLFIATSFFAFGALLNKAFPAVHSYAWMILSVALVKAFGLFPQKFEICCYQWFQFVMNNLTGVLLVGIGIGYTDLNQIATALTPQYVALVTVTVLGAIIGAGALGKLVSFYPIESAITAGLCMANMGGTGDVAVLSAARRMELMPFAQVSSRLGGAFILIFSSLALQLV